MEYCVYILVSFSILSTGFVHSWKRNETSYVQLPKSLGMSSEEEQCPPWFFYNTVTGQCECYRSPSTDSTVTCTEQGALLKYGYCMTLEKGQGTFVGRCQYFEIRGHNISQSPGFITLPDNVSELNEYMCGPMKRKGFVCSDCIENFGPSVTFFGYSCSDCSNAWYGIPLYLLLQLVPITVLYLVILFFEVNLTAAPFTAFVLVSQISVYGVTTVFGPYSFETSPVVYYFSAVITFYGIWNLDFFRYIIPPFCLSSSLKIIHIVLLNYVSAFYPLCLIGLTWVCIQLHSRNIKLFVWLWSLLDKYHVTQYLKKDNKSPMVDVFSTFLLLSYTKMLAVFIATIEPDFILSMHSYSTRRVLYVDPSIELFGTYNLPIVVTSFFLFVVLLLPPTLILALYPTKRFRYLLLRCSFSGRTKAALNIFVEKFYSSYKDGLDGGRDMRGLASLYFIIRIVLYLLSIAERYLLYGALLIGGSAIFIAATSPYKETYMNIIDSLLLASLAFNLIMFDLFFRETLGSPAALFYALVIGVVGSIPMWGLLGFVACKIISSMKLFTKLNYCKKLFSNYGNKSRDIDNCPQNMPIDHSELPDRVINPERYCIENPITVH